MLSPRPLGRCRRPEDRGGPLVLVVCARLAHPPAREVLLRSGLATTQSRPVDDLARWHRGRFPVVCHSDSHGDEAIRVLKYASINKHDRNWSQTKGRWILAWTCSRARQKTSTSCSSPYSPPVRFVLLPAAQHRLFLIAVLQPIEGAHQ